jgi:hypothetical protein
LATIECDGASYHSALSVRDRDRIRQEILESLGWRGRIWRIWSTDWFRTPRQETEKLISLRICEKAGSHSTPQEKHGSKKVKMQDNLQLEPLKRSSKLKTQPELKLSAKQ